MTGEPGPSRGRKIVEGVGREVVGRAIQSVGGPVGVVAGEVIRPGGKSRAAKWFLGLGGLACIGCAMAIALFAAMFSSTPYVPAQAACGTAAATADGSPTILGASTLSAAQITAWWQRTHGSGMPIGVDPATFVGWFIDHGAGEGVRGDLAFAQAVAETGGFTNPDSVFYNNYAGIGHYDGAPHGIPFASPEVGVVADLQTLKEVATGSNGPFAEAKVAPNWGGRPAATWYLLGNQGGNDKGYWASAPAADYWKGISGVYTAMGGVLAAGPATLVSANPAAGATTTTTVPAPASAGCAALTSAAGLPTGGSLGPLWAFLAAQMGKPYQWGGAGPDSWDCSGLTMAAYAQVGIQLPHNAALQYQVTGASMIPLDQLQPGDLVFFEADIGHVGIYVGGGQMIDAPHTGAFVEKVPLWSDQYQGASTPFKQAV